MSNIRSNSSVGKIEKCDGSVLISRCVSVSQSTSKIYHTISLWTAVILICAACCPHEKEGVACGGGSLL